MKKLRKNLPVIIGLVAVVLLYSAMSASDMQEEDRSADYVRDIMASAKAQALAERNGEEHTLMEWSEQFTPPAPLNQLAQAAQ
jgi:hypothetical protein